MHEFNHITIILTHFLMIKINKNNFFKKNDCLLVVEYNVL